MATPPGSVRSGPCSARQSRPRGKSSPCPPRRGAGSRLPASARGRTLEQVEGLGDVVDVDSKPYRLGPLSELRRRAPRRQPGPNEVVDDLAQPGGALVAQLL